MEKAIGKIKNHFKNNSKEKNVIEFSLLFILITQFIVLVFFNLFLQRSHMGYDSSWGYVKAVLMWQNKAILSNKWDEQTNIAMDSPLPIAAFIYGIVKNVYVAFGITNILIIISLLLCINSILSRIGTDLISKLIAFNLIICPYLSNGFWAGSDLGYMSNMLVGGSYYSIRVLIVLLIVREYLYIREKNDIDFLGYLTLFLCVIAGLSSGVFIFIVILLPYLLFEIEKMFVHNNLKVLISLESLYNYMSIICIIIGKLFCTYVLHFTAIDTSRTWTPISNILTNFLAPFQGIMKLLTCLPVRDTNVSIMSLEGIIYLFPLFILFMVFVSIIYTIKTVSKESFDSKADVFILILNVIVINYITFSLFNATYGASLFEERYVLTTYSLIIIIIASFINNLDLKLLFTKFIVVAFVFSILFNNIISDTKYVQYSNESWQMSEISEIVNKFDAKLVYCWGNDFRSVGRCMRAYDMNHIYKWITDDGHFSHWGDYLYYEDNSEYSGSTILMVMNGSSVVPENIMKEYSLVGTLDSVSIYKCNYNPIDLAAGITGVISVDYPSTTDIKVKNGSFEGNSFITNGNDGIVMYGPYSETKDGIYNFTLEYEIINGDEAYFDVVIDDAASTLGRTTLDTTASTATLSNIKLEDGHSLEYRVICENGTIIKIKRIIIEKEEK